MKISSNILNKLLTITVDGDFVGAYSQNFDSLFNEINTGQVSRIEVVARNLKTWDTSLLVFVAALQRCGRDRKIKEIKYRGFSAGAMNMIRSISQDTAPQARIALPLPWIERLGSSGIDLYSAIGRGLGFLRAVFVSVGRFFRGVANVRRVDWLFALEDVGPRAILIVSLISFLIGLILAFVGAAQLKLFGAQVYIASLVAIASIRIMGAMMTGIIMAGRSGAAYAATIGTMQTNEELDALQTMGINKIDFLVLPRLFAMMISMPMLTLLADVMAVLGGAFIGVVMLGIPLSEYISYTNIALDMQNFLVGIFHGAVYGVIIALCGCYYGINCGRNASAVGHATTRAVVASIVWMVVATGIITFIFEVLGI